MRDVILLAKGDSRRSCPFDADEVWGLSNVFRCPEFKGKRIDKMFLFDPLPEQFIKDAKEVAPVVSWRDYADIKYPLEEIISRFNTKYFTNSICYMIAYAIYLKVPKIRLYGIDAAFGGIYSLEKSGVEYWLGRAEENGLAVEVSEGSNLLRTSTGDLYGEEVTGGKVPLFFCERLQLLNLIPRKGHYEDVAKAEDARWVFSIKENEGEKYGVKISKNSDGSISFFTPQEFAVELWLPNIVWDYVRDILIETEEKGELPVDASTVYEKLVLYGGSDWR